MPNILSIDQGMEVYKFGGASLENAQAIKNVADIIIRKKNSPLVVVVSAMGKTTNALEALLHACIHNTGKQQACLEQVRAFHVALLEELLGAHGESEAAKVIALLDELGLACQEVMDASNYDYHYDQLVSFGERISSCLVHGYLTSLHHDCLHIPIAKSLITDSTFREGKVDWELSEPLIQAAFQEEGRSCFITQGFIAGNSKGDYVTLGREGSDYSAAILGNILNASRVTVWKDVPGILNADPRWSAHAVKLDEVSYQEAMELSYYGAQVLHPNTVKPLFEKNIALVVRSFLDREAEGTIISSSPHTQHGLPIYIRKENQTLISISPLDGSFIMEEHIPTILSFFHSVRLKINLLQVSALEFSLCVDENTAKRELLQRTLSSHYQFKYNNSLTLYTIRHYNDESFLQVMEQHTLILMEQKTRNTCHLVLK